MKKIIFTLNVDNFAPEVTELTYPYLKLYAYKIGADFYVINERLYPTFPVTYEKFQIYELAKRLKYDWYFYIDADALIHPDMFDPTSLLNKDTVAFTNKDFVPTRFRLDQYFLRDGRNIGEGNWFTVASDWCLDLWHPLDDITIQEAIENIFPIHSELMTVIRPDHLIDDYVISRNIARYGLKHFAFIEMIEKYKVDYTHLLFHSHFIAREEKVVWINKMKNMWGLK